MVDGYYSTCSTCGHASFEHRSTARRVRPGNCSVDGCDCHAFIQTPKATVKKSTVDHPSYYGGKDNVYEAIKVIEAWGLGFNVGNCVKYLSRAGKKDPAKLVEDLEKAKWYLTRALENAKAGKPL